MTSRGSAPNLTHAGDGGVASAAAETDVPLQSQPAAAWGYGLRRIPSERQPVLDRLVGASRRFQVHALLELDVTEAAAG